MHAALLLPFLLGLAAAAAPRQVDLEAIDRDDAAAERAVGAGDAEAALKYFDYFGHEQERFARSTVAYRQARHDLGVAVTEKIGRDAWRRAAASLGVPRHERDPRKRSVRREGGAVFVKNPGALHETPYVLSDGVWKVSVREVLLLALRARFGHGVDFEEADLHVLAGKMGAALEERAGRLRLVTEAVRNGRIRSTAELEAAVDSVREGRSG